VAAVTLRNAYRPLRPDLDGFLFTQVGEERRGIPLSMISALTQLGLDPWEEAARLSSLSRPEAVEQLARLMAELPDRSSPLPEARQLAGALVERLPKFGYVAPTPKRNKRPWHRRWPKLSRQSHFYVLCAAAAAVSLLSILLHGGF
jgi:hypothetical protein